MLYVLIEGMSVVVNVDLQYDEISLTFTAGPVCLCGVSSPWSVCEVVVVHLRCTQCSILLHLMDICFLTCICLWQISQIQTFLFKVV